MKHILITGCGGFIGSHLAEAEIAAGNKVTGFDLERPDKAAHLTGHPRFTYRQGDIRSRDDVEPLVQNADIVYHLAAIANVQAYCDNPIRVMDVNVDGTRVVAGAAARYGAKVVFSSSSEAYGKNPRVPFVETGDSVLGPTEKARWCYATSKLLGEHYLLAHASAGARVTIARFFNFYGPRLDLLGYGRVIPCFLEKFLTSKPVEVVEPGDQTRCFTYIADGVDALMRMAHHEAADGQIFNIGDTREISMIELASLMKTLGGFSSPIAMIPGQQFYGDGHEEIFRRVPNVDKIRTMLEWQASTPLEEGLSQTIQWFRDNSS